MRLFIAFVLFVIIYALIMSPYLPVLRNTEHGFLTVLKPGTRHRLQCISTRIFALLNTSGIEFWLAGAPLLTHSRFPGTVPSPVMEIAVDHSSTHLLRKLRRTINAPYELAYHNSHYVFSNVRWANVRVVVHVVHNGAKCTIDELGQCDEPIRVSGSIYPLREARLLGSVIMMPNRAIDYVEDLHPELLQQSSLRHLCQMNGSMNGM